MTSVPAIVVPAAARHTATLIFLHGLGDTGYGWSPISENFRLRRKFDENMGMRMPGWYDIKDFGNLNATDDEQGMMKSVTHINKIISEQTDKGIPPERIIVGGFSQGSVIAMLTGLTSERSLGGIICLSGYLPFREKIASMRTEKGKKLPIFMGHGTKDPVVKHVWGEMSRDLLVGMGQDVTWKSYPDLEHSATPQEINDVEKWIDARLSATASKA
ncbi:Phospholipase/carboxylesterase/thioesterase [Kalaharituber pfeilii]|nr:Phospholipase/carboxylesterase/thioesterase [Kalaharituber pfeilii]